MIDTQYGIAIMGGREVSRPYWVCFSSKASGFYPWGDATALAGEGGVRGVVWLIQASAWNQTCHITNDRCEALASLKGCFLCFCFSSPVFFHWTIFLLMHQLPDLEIGDKEKGSRPPVGCGEAGLLYWVGKSLWIRWAIPRFSSRRCRVFRLLP